jgi:DNA-binding transcriptional LysR family regulator
MSEQMRRRSFITLLGSAAAWPQAARAQPNGLLNCPIYGGARANAQARFVSAESGSVLRFNADRFSLKVLPVDFAVRPWQVGIVTLRHRTMSPAVHTFLECVRAIAAPLAKTRLPSREDP